jgi:hypothetical protein
VKPVERPGPRDEEIDAIVRLAGATWWVQTPCGLAGPYPSQEAARSAGQPLGFPVVRRLGGAS